MKVCYALTLIFVTLVTACLDKEESQLLDALIESHINKDAKSNSRASKDTNNYVDNILKKVAEQLKKDLAKNEPFPVPDLPIKEIKDKNVQVNITLTNIKENKASQLVVNKLKSNLFLMTEVFDVSFPVIDLEGDYVVSGKVLGKNIHGNGKFINNMTNLHTWGQVYAKLVKGKVQIKSLNLDYTIKGIKAKATNLKVEGLSEEKVDQLLNTALLRYFTDNERLVSDTISGIVINQANMLLSGMSISDLINWLRHFITPPSSYV